MGSCQVVYDAGYATTFSDAFTPVFPKAIAMKDATYTITIPDKAEFIRNLEVVTDPATIPEGVYTWILYKPGTYSDEQTQFAATKAWSALELGTAHLALAAHVRAATIHGAGELKSTGGKIEYNLLSGTFVQTWLSSRKEKPLCGYKDLQTYIDGKFREKFPTASLHPSTFITPASMPPFNDAELAHYRRKGFEFTRKGGRRKTRRRRTRKTRKSRASNRA
jgi:hypothetical protein